ncbi:MAG: hypothetical protein ACFFCF_10795 [Promethearchaeota archaeon]
MSNNPRTNDEYSGDGKPPQAPSPGDEASARKIIADYLDQVKARLPSDVAAEVIPELRSHLLEQASQPSGHLTTAAAWDAVVSMGSPDIVAREFRREKEQSDIEKAHNFLDALTPQYRQYFWWIIIGIVIADLALIAYLVSVVLLNMSVVPIIFLLPYILLGVVAQVWVFAGIIISYLVMLLLSHPSGPPITEILRGIMQDYDRKEERRIHRTKKRVQKRVKKYNELTGRGHLIGKLFGHILGITFALIFAIVLPVITPTYPTFDISVLYWLAFFGLTHAGLTTVRILVGDSSLAAARLFASIDTLYALVGVWTLSLFFYGPLSWPIPIWNGAFWTLIVWKSLIMPWIWWLGPILIFIALIAMIIELVQVNVYIQPLHNGYEVSIDEF